MTRIFVALLGASILFLTATVPAALAGRIPASAALQEPSASALLEEAKALEAAGDWVKAKATLARTVHLFPGEVQVARAQARLLDAAGDPGRRAAYERLVTLLREKGEDDRAARRRLALLDLAAGDRKAAEQTGALALPALGSAQAGAGAMHIPGPLAAFRRMAAISTQTSNEELLPALARNMVTLGYHYSQRLNKTTPTEYLVLLIRYLDQARELEKMGGADGQLRVSSCEEAQPLLKALGYKLRKGCGPGAVVETDDPARAFITVDSGFPLADLEGAFRNARPFVYAVRGQDVPVLFGPQAWFDKNEEPVDQLVGDRTLARLYYAMSRLDTRTADALRQSPGLVRLREVAPTLDFYGSSLSVESGRPVLPGGVEQLPQWAKLAGADAAKPGEFLFALLDKDDGWLAAYADSLNYADARQRAYFFAGNHLPRFYQALRGQNTTPGSARPIFRPSAELLLLPARLRLGADGRPLIPGGVGAWKTLFQQRTPKGRRPPQLNDPDDVMEAMFARVRLFEENGLLNIFLALNEVDRRRSRPLDPNTVVELAREYGRFSHHYSLFADWPEITDASIHKFLKVSDSLVKIRSPLVKGDALGTFQALVGLWEILARQGQIPENALNSSFDALISRFGSGDKHAAVFDSGRAGVEALLAAAGARATPEAPAAPGASRAGTSVEETVIGLLAGPPAAVAAANQRGSAGGPAPALGAGSAGASLDVADEPARQAREHLLNQLRSAMDAQRLIPLDTLFGLADAMERTRQFSREAVLRMAGQLREFRLPSPFVTAAEKNAAFPGYWTERHLDQMRDLDPGQLVEKHQRGQLAPFLRDTLVGLNYAYYAPPGAQVIFHSPLFVRSHDFLGRSGSGTGNEIWGPAKISGTGWPLSGGGRLVGALSGLAYGLAEAEQDFLVPQHTQALIWNDLAPQMLVSAIIPRWWQATPQQQRWVALNQRFAEDLLAQAVTDRAVRDRLFNLLRGKIEPRRRELLEGALEEARLDTALRLLTPSELFQLSRAWTGENPRGARNMDSPAGEALAALAAAAPSEIEDARISRLFGVPHPKLARSWRPELVGLPPFPALQGYSSRLLAESWESNNLYWARLADEMGLHPAALHSLVPQLTRRLIENIFANHHEDWPAVLRALYNTAEEYRRQVVASAATGPVTE